MTVRIYSSEDQTGYIIDSGFEKFYLPTLETAVEYAKTWFGYDVTFTIGKE